MERGLNDDAVVVWYDRIGHPNQAKTTPTPPPKTKPQIRARMEDCGEAHVPMTNYGLLLAFAASPRALLRAVRPYGVEVPLRLLEAGGGSLSAPPPSCHEHLLPERGGQKEDSAGVGGVGGCSRRDCPLCLSALGEAEGKGAS